MKNLLFTKIQKQKLPPFKYFKIGQYSVKVRPVASASLSAKKATPKNQNHLVK